MTKNSYSVQTNSSYTLPIIRPCTSWRNFSQNPTTVTSWGGGKYLADWEICGIQISLHEAKMCINTSLYLLPYSKTPSRVYPVEDKGRKCVIGTSWQ